MSLKNIKLSVFRKFLEHKGLKKIRTNGGHEVWSRNDLARPVVLQTHEDPVPEFIIKNNLRTIKSSRVEFDCWLNPGTEKKAEVSDLIDFAIQLSPETRHLN